MCTLLPDPSFWVVVAIILMLVPKELLLGDARDGDVGPVTSPVTLARDAGAAPNVTPRPSRYRSELGRPMTGAERMRRCRAKKRTAQAAVATTQPAVTAAATPASPAVASVTPSAKAPLSLVPTSVHSNEEERMKGESARARQLSMLLPTTGGMADPPKSALPAQPKPDPKPNQGDRNAGTRGSRLAEGWRPDPADVAFARGLGLDVEWTLDKFRDHWLSATKGATKRDWAATWRNWCRRDAEQIGRTAPQRQRSVANGSGYSRSLAALARIRLPGDP